MNNIFITVFILEQAVVDDLVGPFEDHQAALNWINEEVAGQQDQYPSYKVDQSEDGEITMFGDESEEDPHGFVYQILPVTTPAELISADGD